MILSPGQLSVVRVLDRVTPAWWAVAGMCGLAVTIGVSLMLPDALSSFFDGPEGTRWAGPCILTVGTALSVWLATIAAQRKYIGSWSGVAAAGVTAGLVALMCFVSVQRMSSGLRVYETFNALLAQRVAAGHDLYADGATAPLGSIYPPLYYLLSGGIFVLLPQFLTNGKLISLLSAILSGVLVYRTTRTLGGTRTAALWGSALFAATYGTMGTCYDNAAADPLAMLLTVAALSFFVKNTSTGDCMALVLAGLGGLCKQPAAFHFLVIAAFMIGARRGLRAWWPIGLWAVVAVAVVAATHGRAWTYLVTYPAGHPFREFPPTSTLFRLFVLQAPLWVLLLSTIVRARNTRFAAFAGAVLLSAILGIWKSGGWMDALDPWEPILCIGAALGMMRGRSILLAAQVILGLYNPFAAISPWSSVRDVDREMTLLAQSSREDVWFPAETHLAVAAGKPEWDHFAAIESVCWGGTPVPQRLLQAIHAGRFSVIACRHDSYRFFRSLPPEILREVDQRYTREKVGGLVVFRRAQTDQ